MKIKKQWAAALLLAGTAVGSGMISLPMVLAKFGIVKSCVIMLFFAALTFLSAIIRADLNLNLHADATLEDVGKAFQCPWAGIAGNFLLKLLTFALLAAYLFGFSSILCSLFNNVCAQSVMLLVTAIGTAIAFILAPEFILNVNNSLFIGMFCVFIGLVVALFLETQISFIPEQTKEIALRDWTTIIPVLFTAFGMQGSIHSVTKFCQNDRIMIRNACAFGCIVTVAIYIVWTTAILMVVANTDATFFQQMVAGKATDVGALVAVLSKAAASQWVQIVVWTVSVFAILTSILGAGLALLDIFEREWRVSKWQTVSIIVFVPAAVSMLIPNAFIKILNVSGVILSLIAIVIPVIISLKMQKLEKLKCELLMKNKILMFGVLTCGIVIIGLGLWDLVR